MTTQTQLDNLKDMKRQGVTKAVYDGLVMEYRSLKEINSIISEMEDEIAGTSSSDKTYYPTFGRAY